MKGSLKQTFKNSLIIAILFALFIFLFATPQGMKLIGFGPKETNLNIPLPEFSVLDLEGNRIKLGKQTEAVLIINFFSINCSACVAEMPYLRKLKMELKNYPFEIIAISEDFDRRKVATFFKKEPVNFPVYIDEMGKAAETFGVRELPTSFIVNSRNVIKKVIRGPILDEEKILKIVLSLLQK